jgi:signal transduction histidine kinase
MMASSFKSVLFSIFLLYSAFIFSQVQPVTNVLNNALHKKALEYKKEVNYTKAQYFFAKKNWDSTLVYSMKQLSLSSNKELDDYSHFLRGSSFRELKLFQEAKKELNLISGKFVFYPLVNFNLGIISLELREFEKATHYFHAVEKLPLQKSQPFKISSVYANLGVCYLHLNKFVPAEAYLSKSYKLRQTEKDTIPLINSYLNIANLYYLQYKDAQAIPYFEKAYVLSKKVNDLQIKKNAALNMAAVEENRGQFKLALVYRKEYEQWKDSLNNQNKVWAVAAFEKKFAVAQKEKKITVLEVANKLKKTQRDGLFYSAILLLILLTAGVYFYGQKVKNSKIILAQKEKLDQLNATKDTLFSIVSHDLRSSVNALKTSNSKLLENLNTKNYSELDQLLKSNSAIANSTYNLLDNLLNWALLQTKQLYFQKESVHLFSIIQQIEYNYTPLLLDKQIRFENTVPKNLFIFVDLDSLKIILRNIVDNAIKFSPENSKITIYAQEGKDDHCQLVIEDKGLGIEETSRLELLKDSELLSKKSNSEIIGTGLGMQLCKSMLKKNNGFLAIESQLNFGTKMILSFPKTETNG